MGERLRSPWLYPEKTEQLRSYLVSTDKGTLLSALVITTKNPLTEHSTDDPPSETTRTTNSTLSSLIPQSQQLPQTPKKPKAESPTLTTSGTAPAAGSPHSPCTTVLTTRSGRVVRPPERLDL